MAKEVANERRVHLFSDALGLEIAEAGEGFARLTMPVQDHLMNSRQVVHCAAIFAMADNCMAAALDATLDEGEVCSTIEIKINYLRPVSQGELVCDTTVLHRGRSTGVVESTVTNSEQLIAKALGTFAIDRTTPGAE